MNESFVNVGNKVNQGDEIGLSGNRCGSTGAHLHFSRWVSGKESKVTFADASVQEHDGIVRPSKSANGLYFLYKADGDVPTDDEADNSSNTPFPDVQPGDTFFDYVMALYYQGAINGYSNGNFGPDDYMTRGQMAKVIVRALSQQTEYDDGECAFPDVCPGHTFYHDIRRIKELGITSGYSDGEYKPGNELSRGAMAKFITIAHDGSEPSYSTCSEPFPDVACDSTFYPHIRRLKEIFDNKGVGLGYSDGLFRPDDTLSRGGATKLTVVGLGLEEWIPPFPDVLPDNTFYRYIKTMKERGITDGFSDGEYKPERNVTRGESSKFVTRGMGIYPSYTDGRQSFPDVSSSHTFYDYIEYLKENDIVSGYSNGNFGPEDNITRGQMAKIIINGLGVQGLVCEYNATPYFPDVPTDHTFYNEIQCLKDFGITSGYSDGTYKPDDNITRGQMSKFIVLAFVDVTPEVEQELSESINDDYTTAPVQELYDPDSEKNEYDTDVDYVGSVVNYVVSTGDDDWFQVDAVENETYELNTQDTGLNAGLEIVVAGSTQNIVDGIFLRQATLNKTTHIDEEISLTWTADQTGKYYVRIRNTKEFAKEGAYTNVSVQLADSVPTVITGDVNCDDTVDVVDAMFIMQYGVDMRTASTTCPASGVNELYEGSCDVSGDSTCNVVDAMFIMQCNVDIANAFCPVKK